MILNLERWIPYVYRMFRRKQKGYGISILIPFRRSRNYPRQEKNFRWVVRYWQCQLPGAEIIHGRDRRMHGAFSKSRAVNHAARRATGDIFVIADSDCFIDVDAVFFCASEIRRARRRGQRLWFIPYRKFFRLTDQAARRVLQSEPCNPYQFPTPPHANDEDSSGFDDDPRRRHHRRRHCWSGSRRGHHYGAAIQIMPREAFEAVEHWDERFEGWGGEDYSAMRAMDTLYWPHKTINGQVLHLWHPMFSRKGAEDWVDWSERLWAGQKKPGINGRLTTRYTAAMGNPEAMRALLDEDMTPERRITPPPTPAPRPRPAPRSRPEPEERPAAKRAIRSGLGTPGQ